MDGGGNNSPGWVRGWGRVGAEEGRGPWRRQQCWMMLSLSSLSFLSLWDRNLRGQVQGSVAPHGWGVALCSSPPCTPLRVRTFGAALGPSCFCPGQEPSAGGPSFNKDWRNELSDWIPCCAAP